MKIHMKSRALAGAAACLGVMLAAAPALADVKDYEFQLADPTVKVGKDTPVSVRLINKTTGKPVPNAVIFETRLDMAPDSMPEMAAKITPVAGGEPGVYRFKADVGMAGGWQLTLGAKVQGESGVVQGKLVFRTGK